MKKILSLSLALLFIVALIVPGAAIAATDIQNKALFTLFSSAFSTATNSAVTNTGLRTRKTVIINGYKTASTFGNFSGTFVLKGAPTSTGPWVTLKDINGNAVSATANTIYTVDDLSQFIMGTYTRGAGRGAKKIGVFLYYAE